LPKTPSVASEICVRIYPPGTSPALITFIVTSSFAMEIKFNHDVDRVLKEAKKQNKPVLLDFSAAPM
jgi:hypothetical protein